PLLAVAWSLIFELWFYLVFTTFLTMPRRYLPALLTLWGGVLVAVEWCAIDIKSPTLKVVTSPYAIEFIAGCAGYFLYRRASPRLAKTAVCFGFFGLVALVTASPRIAETVSLYRTMTLGLIGSCLLSGVAALERNGNFRFLARLKWTGDISYVVYLSHVLVLSAVGRIWMWLADGIELSVLLVSGFWSVATMVVIAAGLFTHHLIEAPLGRFLNRRSYRRDASSHKASTSSGDIAIAEPIKSNS
ncbi:acyltransferase family protein, partial [Klebsiella pneumoniae]